MGIAAQYQCPCNCAYTGSAGAGGVAVRLPLLQRRHGALAPLARVPSSVLILVGATTLVALTGLNVETVGSRFGGASTFPALMWPDFSWATVRFLFIPATTLALLGAIESLLCARVADSMIDDRHDPNQELMAQGIANFVTPFFGGMPATGTIAAQRPTSKTALARQLLVWCTR